MDLALHLGMTEAGLASSMTERELRGWQQYAAKRMLPMRRIELYLAQMAMFIVKAQGGGRDLQLHDFLFDPSEVAEVEDAAPVEELTPADIAEQFGAVVYRKKAT